MALGQNARRARLSAAHGRARGASAWRGTEALAHESAGLPLAAKDMCWRTAASPRTHPVYDDRRRLGARGTPGDASLRRCAARQPLASKKLVG